MYRKIKSHIIEACHATGHAYKKSVLSWIVIHNPKIMPAEKYGSNSISILWVSKQLGAEKNKLKFFFAIDVLFS